MSYKIRRHLRRLSVLLVLFLAAAAVTPTVEARILVGTYAGTTARSCTVSNGIPFGLDGSGSPTLVPPGAVRQISVDTTIVTLNADGTGTTISRSEAMNATATSGGILSFSDSSHPFTYTVNDEDNTLEISNGESTFTVVLGSGIGITGTVSPRTGRWQIGSGEDVLVSAPPDAIQQETVTLNLVGGGVVTQFRICTRSTTLTRVRP